MMLYFQSVGEAEAVFKALSTPMRLKIMEMIYKNDSLSMNDLAEALGLTNGAISMHVSKLEEADLVKIKTTSGKRGTMKIVRPKYDMVLRPVVLLQAKRLSVLLMIRAFSLSRTDLMQVFYGLQADMWNITFPTICNPVRL